MFLWPSQYPPLLKDSIETLYIRRYNYDYRIHCSSTWGINLTSLIDCMEIVTMLHTTSRLRAITCTGPLRRI